MLSHLDTDKIDTRSGGDGRLARARGQLLRGLRALAQSSCIGDNAAISRRAFWFPTTAAMLLALIGRLFVLYRAAGMMDSDEAVFGVQAERILHGAHPIYFYGQAYMGSWDAYLLAPIVAIFGPSAGAIHAVTLVESLILIPLMGALAVRLYGRRALYPALLFTALPPLYVVVTQLRMLGGYVETLDLGVALMLVMTVIVQRWETGRQTTWYWALAGFLAGFGMWIDPLIVYYVIACALWIAPLALSRVLVDGKQQIIPGIPGIPGKSDATGAPALTNALGRVRLVGRRFRPAVRYGALGAAAALVGAAPAVYYALTNQFANVLALRGRSPIPGASPLRLGTLRYFLIEAVPTIVGARFPYPFLTPETLIADILRFVAAAAAGVALIYTAARLVAPGRSTRTAVAWRTRLRALAAPASQRWNDGFPLILIAVVLLIFWRGGATNLPLSLYIDEERYTLPLITSLILLSARLCGDLSSLKMRRESLAGASELLTDAPEREVAGVGEWVAPSIYTGPSPLANSSSRSPGKTPRRLGALGGGYGKLWLGALVVLMLIAYAAPYLLTNEVAAMESPFDPGGVFPAVDSNMIAYLKSHQIHDVWASHWTGNVIIYLSNQQVRCADYVDQTILHGQKRFPDIFARVSAANKPSFIITSKPSDGEPLTARALDALGVTYVSARFGNYVVITPLSRTVYPEEIAWALVDNYYNNA